MMEVRRVINIHRGDEYIRLEIVSNSDEGHSPQPLPTIIEENISYLDDYIESPFGLPFLRLLTESGGIQEIADRLREIEVNEQRPKCPVSQRSRAHLEKNHHKADTSCSCSVCQSDYESGEEAVTLPCGHHFHPDCIYAWFKDNNTCPICRQEIQVLPDRETAAKVIARNIKSYLVKRGFFTRMRGGNRKSQEATRIQSLIRGYLTRRDLGILEWMGTTPKELTDWNSLGNYLTSFFSF